MKIKPGATITRQAKRIKNLRIFFPSAEKHLWIGMITPIAERHDDPPKKRKLIVPMGELALTHVCCFILRIGKMKTT